KMLDKLIAEKKKFCVIVNKIDLANFELPKKYKNLPIFYVSSLTGAGVKEVKDNLAKVFKPAQERHIIADLIDVEDIVVLVIPIDSSAPKGRIILPQVQTLREILDKNAVAMVAQNFELKYTIDNLKKKPKLVVTDSQAIMKVVKDTPKDINVTTFSILFARYKGDLEFVMKGLERLKNLQDNDKILIIEACTHHPMPEDIGRVKIPKWLIDFTKKKLNFEFFAGKEIPKNLGDYKLGIHCGGCMLTPQETRARMDIFADMDLPIVNYGIIISYIHNAFPRVLKPFPDLYEKYKNFFN
ncbi:MAG TPA: [FeFe] hydrogenase H-cluster maturation GTPase HydF, partial [bacterium]|nr:[FeFe] hydrogenase H-cluster maturation GTPase HydF [bacterium]